MTIQDTTTIEAPAKVNLFLRVLGRRPDGYHDIESLVVPISLADRLAVHAHADPSQFRTLSLSLEVRGEPDLVRPVPADESNLILRAASALAEAAGTRGFAEFFLDKRIPTAAGLGGGSSDAAAALRALNDLWGAGLDEATLGGVAALVGSDVPALLAGRPVLARGRGEIVEASPGPHLDLVLVPFDFGVRTEDAYRWWDEDGGPQATGVELFNDLEEPVIRRHPRIREVKELLLAAGSAAAFMCGSGPTMTGILGPRGLDPDTEHDLTAIAGRSPIRAATVG